MSYPHSIFHEGVAANDNELLFTSEDLSSCNEHFIHCVSGSIDIEVTHAKNANIFTASTSFPVAVMLLNTTNPSQWATVLAAGQTGLLLGHYEKIRVRQFGVPASSAHMASYKRSL